MASEKTITTELRLKISSVYQLIGYAQSADHDEELPMAWRKRLVQLAKDAEKTLHEAFNG